MEAAVHFFPEHHVFYRRAIATTADEVRQQQAEDIQFLAEVEMPVHIIADLRYTEYRPKNLSEMKDGATSMDSPNLRWLVMIMESNPVLKFVVSTGFQIVAREMRVKIVSSVEEAYTFLGDVDSTLDIDALRADMETVVGVTV